MKGNIGGRLFIYHKEYNYVIRALVYENINGHKCIRSQDHISPYLYFEILFEIIT